MMKHLLAVLSALALSLTGCEAPAEEPRATGTFTQELAGPYDAWVARHGLSGSQYQTEFDTWVGQA
ncbi:hypothetical protein JQX13_37915 [Archangium violaceum]|uniref:hypothetical protein n=1 Tax=Archangium violaceum TaxID=83451 RepID=UPI00193C0718|nr:hypothetical protein [Archangium violaceum]QRK05874.1 hypothetical protein JQX13_37915 [Archangium violaceum]